MSSRNNTWTLDLCQSFSCFLLSSNSPTSKTDLFKLFPLLTCLCRNVKNSSPENLTRTSTFYECFFSLPSWLQTSRNNFLGSTETSENSRTKVCCNLYSRLSNVKKKLSRTLLHLFENSRTKVLETPSKLSDFKKQLSQKVRCLLLETLETLD